MTKSSLRMDQFLPSFSDYDAIGNEAQLLQKFIRHKGYQSDIFVEENHCESVTKKISDYEHYDASHNILINHFSIGASFNLELFKYKCFKVTRFHNITPPDYFLSDGLEHSRNQCFLGYSQIPVVQKNTHYYWSASLFNESFLKKYRFSTGDVVPVLRNYKDLLNKKMTASLAEKLLKNKRIKIIFVGRVMPHKGQVDLLFLLKQLKDFLPVPCQIIIAGSQDPLYTENVLHKVAHDLGLSIEKNLKAQSLDKDIILPGPISEEELATLYYYSDVFLSLSDHEGFGVPFVEAMSFNLPVVTQPIAAAREVCGDAAIYVDKNNNADMFFKMRNIVMDKNVRTHYAKKSREQAKNFEWEKAQDKLEQSFDSLLKFYEAQ